MDFFRDIGNDSNTVLFEKSANYFDNRMTPFRAHALLPDAKIITILVDPVKRAYSWYQVSGCHGNQSELIYYKSILLSLPLRDAIFFENYNCEPMLIPKCNININQKVLSGTLHLSFSQKQRKKNRLD